MRILHTIEGFGAKFGGIASCTRDLLAAMRNGKDVVELLTPGLRDHSDRFLGAPPGLASASMTASVLSTIPGQ
jgi:hypothetical protein